MKKSLPLLVVALGLALVITGCESDNVSSRAREKSEVYATLKPWQKKKIDNGIVAVGFSPDMVYLAIGHPTTKEPTGTGELWTYKRYFPTAAAEKAKRALNTESRYTAAATLSPGTPGGNAPTDGAMGSANMGALAGTQGSSMEPADMVSYTLWVTFDGGIVTHLKLEPNP